MKKGAVIGIIAGVVAVNFLGFGMLGAYLKKAKAASAQVVEHNAKVEVVNDSINSVLSGNSAKYRAGAGDAMADYDYGYDEAEYANESPADSAGPGLSCSPSDTPP